MIQIENGKIMFAGDAATILQDLSHARAIVTQKLTEDITNSNNVTLKEAREAAERIMDEAYEMSTKMLDSDSLISAEYSGKISKDVDVSKLLQEAGDAIQSKNPEAFEKLMKSKLAKDIIIKHPGQKRSMMDRTNDDAVKEFDREIKEMESMPQKKKRQVTSMADFMAQASASTSDKEKKKKKDKDKGSKKDKKDKK